MRIIYEKYKKGSVKLEAKAPFAQGHPRINFMIGLALLGILVFAIILFIWFVFSCLGNGIEHLVDFLKKLVSNTDYMYSKMLYKCYDLEQAVTGKDFLVLAWPGAAR